MSNIATEMIESLSCKELCNSVANLTEAAVTTYKVREFYKSIKEALNKIWENILVICDWFNNNYRISHGDIDREEYIQYTKRMLARNDFDVDNISDNINYFYGDGAFDDFSKTMYIIGVTMA